MRNFKKMTTPKWKSEKRYARIEGKPCKHPDKVQPSLEAFGFDMVKTAKNVLGLEIKWSKGLLISEYLTLVCGIFPYIKLGGKICQFNLSHSGLGTECQGCLTPIDFSSSR